MTYLEQYREAIRKGEIIAGQELITALDTYIADMSNPRYVYDTREAYRRIDFMEKFVRLTKSPFYGKPMILMLWQKAFIECLYSFKIAETGRDRFKRAILLIGRKNTKSETCNGLAFTELMIGAPGSDIVCSSNDDSQANILFDGINTMRELFDPKNKRTHKNLSFIKNRRTGTKVFKISDKTRNKEGRNIDFAIIDEVHGPEETKPAETTPTTSTVKGTITVDGLNIRASASATDTIKGTYNKGTVVTILETKNGWGRTDKGWISMQYVKTDSTILSNAC